MTSALGLGVNIPALLTEQFYAELNKYNWGIRYHFTESGNPIINQALPGTADGTGANVVFGAAGGIEGRVAVDFNALTSIMTVNNSSRWNGLTDFSIVWFFNADASIALGWRIAQNVGDQFNFSPRLDGSIDYRVNRATLNATYTSAAGEIAYPTGLMMLAMSYDETNGIIAWRGKSGVLTQITSGAAAVVGTGATTGFTGTLNIGNNAGFTRSFDGRAAFCGFSNPRLSQANLQAILIASGV